MYEATATLPDGSKLSLTGTIEEVTHWADSMINDNEACLVDICKQGE